MRLLAIVLLSFIFSFTYSQDAASLIKAGIKLHDAGQYDQAIDKYLQAISLNPISADAYYEAAFSYHSKKDYENALKMVNKAVELGSDQTKLMATIVKGSIIDDMGDKRQAAKFYKEAIEEYPNHYLLLFNYGITLARLGRYDESEQAYISALTNRFNHPGSHLQLGNLERERNKKDPAMMAYYFFLLLENKTGRSKEASDKLLSLMYNDATEKKQADFVHDTGKYFDELSRLSQNTSTPPPSKKKKKKNQQAQPGFFGETYVPFFTDLNKAGHTEAFCYHIMASLDNPEIEKWVVSNDDKMDHFYTWLKTR